MAKQAKSLKDIKISIDEEVIPTGISEHISARQIMQISKLLPTSEEYLESIFKYWGPSPFFNPKEYNIEGEMYKIGIVAANSYMAKLIGSFLISKKKNELIERLKSEFNGRVLPIESDLEVKNLVISEIDYINGLIEKGRVSEDSAIYGMYSGYTNERRGLKKFDFKKPFTYSSYDQTLQGAASYHFLKYLESLLGSVENVLAAGGSNTSLKFKDQGEIALFFYHSGIYNAISENAIGKGRNTTAAKVIAKLAGMPESWDSIRTAITLAGKLDITNTNSVKLFRRSRLNNVIDLLEENGLSAEKLRLIKDKIKD